MINLDQEYDTYKTDFKNKQKDEVIKELDLVELELEDLIENRSTYEKGSAQSFINLAFAIMGILANIRLCCNKWSNIHCIRVRNSSIGVCWLPLKKG